MSESTTYLKVAQVAAELSVTTQAVYGWINAGKLESIQLAGNKKGALRVSRASLDAFIDAGKVSATAAVAQ